MLAFENFVLVLEDNQIAVFKFTEDSGKFTMSEVVPINKDTILEEIIELKIVDFTVASLGLH